MIELAYRNIDPAFLLGVKTWRNKQEGHEQSFHGEVLTKLVDGWAWRMKLTRPACAEATSEAEEASQEKERKTMRAGSEVSERLGARLTMLMSSCCGRLSDEFLKHF